MKVWKRFVANGISITFIIAFLLKTEYKRDLTFYIFVMPYLLANIAVSVMLFLSLFNKPKGFCAGNKEFFISVLGANLGIIVNVLGVDLFNPDRNWLVSFSASCFALIAIPFYIAGIFALGRNLTVLPEANKLQTTGVYALSRHPLYVTYIYWYILQIFICQSLAAFIVSALQITLQLIRARNEEALLSRVFPEYEDYRRKVGWIGPIFRKKG